MPRIKSDIKVADEVWITAALLHREHPGKEDFATEEIVARAAREAIAGPIRPGVYVHVVQHCVANRAPNPGRYCMLFETALAAMEDRLFADAEQYLLKAIGMGPDFPKATYALARAYLEQNKMQLAEQEMRKYLAARPEDATAQQCHSARKPNELPSLHLISFRYISTLR